MLLLEALEVLDGELEMGAGVGFDVNDVVEVAEVDLEPEEENGLRSLKRALSLIVVC